MAAVASGVVAIGACYGVELTKDDAWKLIREFFKAAGIVYASCFVGGQFIAWLMAATGFGLPFALLLDAGQSTAIAFAVGSAAKHYFRGERSRSSLREVMRRSLSEAKGDVRD